MATVIERETTLETDFRSARQQAKRKFWLPVAMMMLGVAGFVLPVVVDSFSNSFSMAEITGRISTMSWLCFVIGAVWLTILRKLNPNLVRQSGAIVRAGIEGEAQSKRILAQLPDSYTIIPDVKVHTSTGESQLDFVVLSPKGIWVVECKHLNGSIHGSINDQQWQQDKVGRRGGEYSKTFYSPIKQVNTHVGRLKQFHEPPATKRFAL